MKVNIVTEMNKKKGVFDEMKEKKSLKNSLKYLWIKKISNLEIFIF